MMGYWGLGIGDGGWGLGPIPNRQSPIPESHSPNPKLNKKNFYKQIKLLNKIDYSKFFNVFYSYYVIT